MAATLLDGAKIANDIKHEVAEEARRLSETGLRPGLAAVLVGSNPASEIYVRSKVQTCEALGLYSEKITPLESVTTEELLELVHDLNARDEIDGILVQLPLPPQVDSKKVLLAVLPEKDVDGFHPMNVGFLSTQRPGLVPCTPAGIMEMLRRSNIPLQGADAVVVGRSDIVGKPMAMLLTNANATVTICHSKTRDLPGVCRRADILVAAMGRTGFVTRDFVKPGANVIERRHEQDHQPRGVRQVFQGQRKARAGVRQERLYADRRRASRGGRGCRGAHAGPWRRRAADHRYADGQHPEGGEAASWRPLPEPGHGRARLGCCASA